jgi:hypothetical protein
MHRRAPVRDSLRDIMPHLPGRARRRAGGQHTIAAARDVIRHRIPVTLLVASRVGHKYGLRRRHLLLVLHPVEEIGNHLRQSVTLAEERCIAGQVFGCIEFLKYRAILRIDSEELKSQRVSRVQCRWFEIASVAGLFDSNHAECIPHTGAPGSGNASAEMVRLPRARLRSHITGRQYRNKYCAIGQPLFEGLHNASAPPSFGSRQMRTGLPSISATRIRSRSCSAATQFC